MKTIHFVNLYSKKHYLPILLSVVMLFILYFIVKDTEHEKLFYILVNLPAVILISRTFWYKAYVQYTTSRISIRINSTSQLNIKFDDITQIEYSEAKLLLTENVKTHSIDVEDVDPKDVQKLINLMVERSEAFYKDSSNLKYYE